MPHTSNADIDGVRFEEQAGALDTPAAGYWQLYALARGLEYKDDAGAVRRVGIATSDADTANPPSDADLDTAFGQPADAGDGFLALLDDASGDANVYLVASNGTSWWYVALTKAA